MAEYFGNYWGEEAQQSVSTPSELFNPNSIAVRNAIAELWDTTGELTDLDPWGPSTGENPDPTKDLDPNSYGVRYFLRKLSAAQYQLANWKTNRRIPLRFKDLDAVTNIQVGLKTQERAAFQTADSGTIRAEIPVTGMVAEDFDETKIDVRVYYVNDEGVLVNTENSYMTVFATIVSEEYVELTFREDVEYPSQQVVKMEIDYYFKKYRLAPRTVSRPDGFNLVFPQGLKTVQKIIDLSDSTPLNKAYKKDDLVDSGLTSAKPQQWYIRGNYIYFDSYVADPFWLRFEYIRQPNVLTSINDEFDIPEEWHDILIMIATFTIEQARMENEKSQITKSDIDYWISRRRAEHEDDYLRQELQGFYPIKE